MTPEGKVKKEIKDGLTALGAYQFWPVQTGFGKRGIDCYACYKGRMIGIEAKRAEGGRLSTIQRECLGEIVAAGGIGVVARCWEDVREVLP
jgi:hypothetical protein